MVKRSLPLVENYTAKENLSKILKTVNPLMLNDLNRQTVQQIVNHIHPLDLKFNTYCSSVDGLKCSVPLFIH